VAVMKRLRHANVVRLLQVEIRTFPCARACVLVCAGVLWCSQSLSDDCVVVCDPKVLRTEERLYMVMELVAGGEVYFKLGAQPSSCRCLLSLSCARCDA
jgi:serine/threonine protein kinase